LEGCEIIDNIDRSVFLKGRPLKRLPQKRDPLPPQSAVRDTRTRVEKHTYLQVGDRVYHRDFKSWGCGLVIEAWTSEVPGGLCYARIQFQDGKRRVFDNNYDSSCCCYYTGITLLNRIELA
jgi:hypothetical protein